MKKQKILYGNRLGSEWIDWVEDSNSTGSREQEIYPLIKNWLAKIKPAVLIDIGCGQGICSIFAGKKTKYIGIDPSPVLIKRAKEIYSAPNKEFIEGDALRLPWKMSPLMRLCRYGYGLT